MHHIFFIHTSADEHLGCFRVLATVNSAAIHIVLHVSFWIMIFSSMLVYFSSMFTSLYGSCYRKYVIKFFIAIVENVFLFSNSTVGEANVTEETCLFWWISRVFCFKKTHGKFSMEIDGSIELQINGSIEFIL